MGRDPSHHLFFSRAIDGDTIRLDAQETRHAVSVLRLKEGDPLRVTNGLGDVFECVAGPLDNRELAVRVVSTVRHEQPRPRLTLAVGLPERDCFEQLVEHVTALGVTAIVPVVCEYCQERWWSGKWDKHAERIERKMITAVKQSLNPFLPRLDKPCVIAEALKHSDGHMVVADEHGAGLMEALPQLAAQNLCAFVGPPGGFSPAERAAFETAHALFVRLSADRLRTELAATVLCAGLMVGAESR
jgi:16S rRNA (uracil1498-N3)-methyltransferase